MRGKVASRGEIARPVAAKGIDRWLPDEKVLLTFMFLSLLLLLTILFAFITGIALGHWTIFAVLNFFDPARLREKQEKTAATLAPSTTANS